ncbi:hypothetical protein GF352_03860 [archaeon]|nr:hypothetical protein [archaeon]
MKRFFFLLTSLLIISGALGVRECVYDPRGFTFHCSNNMPGTSIGPGDEGNITIVCCFTERSFQDSDETLPVQVEVKGHWFHRVQNPDGSWNEINDTYPASQWITNVSYPERVKGFESFPVVIEYSLPESSPAYQAGAVIQSRVDIMVVMEGGIVPNNAVYPQIRIPDDWEPGGLIGFFNDLIGNNPEVIAGGAGLILVSALAYSISKKKKKRKRMKQILKNKKA